MQTPYLVPVQTEYTEVTLKRSRFIATLARVRALKEMRQFHHEITRQHPKASHNCWAAIAGAPDNSNKYGFSDDGEPSGTAGKPMFKVLHYSGKGQIGVIISRYFGGVKLGTGGLVRAYTEVTQTILEQASFTQYSRSSRLTCSFTYADEALFRFILDKYSVTNAQFDYSEKVTVILEIEEVKVEPFTEEVQTSMGCAFRYPKAVE